MTSIQEVQGLKVKRYQSMTGKLWISVPHKAESQNNDDQR
jgi:hypothetical protein